MKTLAIKLFFDNIKETLKLYKHSIEKQEDNSYNNKYIP